MANHCWNHVVFNGDTTQLKKLQEKFQSYGKAEYFTEFGDFVLDIGKIGDTTEVFEKRHEDAYYTYGTKWWEFDLEDHEEGSEDFTIAGDSAWSPPVSLVEKICIHYGLTANMEYEEGGMDFAGYVEFNNLGITDHKEMTSHEFRYVDDVGSWMENLYYNFEGETNREELEQAMKEEHSYASKTHIKEFINMVIPPTVPTNSINL